MLPQYVHLTRVTETDLTPSPICRMIFFIRANRWWNNTLVCVTQGRTSLYELYGLTQRFLEGKVVMTHSISSSIYKFGFIFTYYLLTYFAKDDCKVRKIVLLYMGTNQTMIRWVFKMCHYIANCVICKLIKRQRYEQIASTCHTFWREIWHSFRNSEIVPIYFHADMPSWKPNLLPLVAGAKSS